MENRMGKKKSYRLTKGDFEPYFDLPAGNHLATIHNTLSCAKNTLHSSTWALWGMFWIGKLYVFKLNFENSVSIVEANFF